MHVEPFLTLPAMRDAHVVLTASFRSQPDNPELVERVRAFLARGCASGKLIESTSERTAAQSILDYWATTLFRRTSEVADATLVEFEADRSRTLADDQCPYPGVRPFDRSFRPYFHGRRALVDNLLSLLERQEVVCLIGENGVGKTSLLQSGLLPALEDRDGSDRQARRFLPPVVPGADPLSNLATAVFGDPSAAPARRAELLADTTCLTRWLDDVSPSGAVLVVDGLEEVFSLCTDDLARRAFADNLVHLARAPARHLLITSIRTRWLTDLASLDELSAVVDAHKVTVPPLSGPQVLEAIQAPAARVGLTFQEGLAEALAIDFLNEPPAILQFALTHLWRRREGTRVSSEAYAAIGRGRKALCDPAEALGIDAGSPNEETLRRVLLALLQAGRRPGEVRAVRVARRDLLRLGDPGKIEVTLDQLVASGLVRASASNTPGDVRLEWIHDVLKDAVPTVQSWLHERELRDVQAIADRERDRADREASLKRKATRRAWASAIAGALAIVLAIVTIQQLARREVQLLASGAERVAQTNPDLALALATRALRKSPDNPQAAGALYKAFFESATKRVFPADWMPSAAPVPVSSVAATKDGRYVLAGSTGGPVTLWDLESGERRLFEPITPNVQGTPVALAPDGDIAMSGADTGSVTLWDARAGKPLTTWSQHSRRVRSLAFSPDGQRAASGSTDDAVWIWTRSNGTHGSWREAGGRTHAHRSNVTAVVFSPDGRLLFSSDEGDGQAPSTVMVWDSETGQLVDQFKATTHQVTSLAVQPNGCTLLAGAADGSLSVWNLAANRPALRARLAHTCSVVVGSPALDPVRGHENAVTSVAFGPDGRYAISGSDDSTIVLWRVEPHGLERLRSFRGHQGRVESVVFPKPDFFVSGSDDASVRLWDLDAALEIDHFGLKAAGGKHPPVTSVGVSADGRVAFASASALPNTVDVGRWDIDSGTSLGTISRPHLERILPVFDRRGTRIVTGTDLDLLVSDPSGGSEHPERSVPKVRPEAVAVSDTDVIAWISANDWRPVVAALRPSAPEPTSFDTLKSDVLRENQPPVFSIALSADGKRLAVGTQTRRVLLFDVETRTAGPAYPTLHTDRVTALAFRPRTPGLASGSRDGTIIVWDLQGNELSRLWGTHNEVSSLAFSPGGELLLTGAAGSGSLLLWHADSGMIVYRFEGHTDRVRGVVISEDGRRAVSGADDGSVRVWKLPGLDPSNLLASVAAKRWIRALTSAEEAEFVSGFRDLLSGGGRK